MKYIRDVGFSIWAIVNLGAAGFVAFFMYALMSLNYKEMHTISTAYDRDPNLTREMVIHSVLVQSCVAFLCLLPLAAFIWGVNVTIFSDRRFGDYKKHGIWLSQACGLLLLSAILLADWGCLSQFP